MDEENGVNRREALAAIYHSLRDLAVGFDRANNPDDDTVTTRCAAIRDLAQAADILADLEAADADEADEA